MPRAIILMLDSLGVGAAPDAEQFGDQSADTFGHIVETCPAIDRSERLGFRPQHSQSLPSWTGSCRGCESWRVARWSSRNHA